MEQSSTENISEQNNIIGELKAQLMNAQTAMNQMSLNHEEMVREHHEQLQHSQQLNQQSQPPPQQQQQQTMSEQQFYETDPKSQPMIEEPYQSEEGDPFSEPVQENKMEGEENYPISDTPSGVRDSSLRNAMRKNQAVYTRKGTWK